MLFIMVVIKVMDWSYVKNLGLSFNLNSWFINKSLCFLNFVNAYG